MALKDISLTSVALITGGAIFGIAAVRGQSVGDTVRSFIQGKNPDTKIQANPLSVSTPDVGSTPVPTTGSGSTANKTLGRMLAASYGWVGSEWTALDSLWTRESGWNNHAKNPSSGAYGIPQALPPTKMPFAAQEGGGSSAFVQIVWGLDYIKQRYGSPSAAWTHEQSHSWY
jgi:resuscitation-promoting factor RpfB